MTANELIMTAGLVICWSVIIWSLGRVEKALELSRKNDEQRNKKS